jgi:hypothetical protein
MLAITSVQWAAVGALIAAFFGGALWVVELSSHRAHRTVMGVKRRLHVLPLVRIVLQPDDGLEVPEDWDKSKVRCFGFDLVNPSPYQINAVVHVERIRVGLAYRHLPASVAFFTENDKEGINVEQDEPSTVWVAIYAERGWKSERPFKTFVKFRVHSTAKEHRLTRRFWLQPVGWKGGF